MSPAVGTGRPGKRAERVLIDPTSEELLDDEVVMLITLEGPVRPPNPALLVELVVPSEALEAATPNPAPSVPDELTFVV
jgi:hypothetical protein